MKNKLFLFSIILLITKQFVLINNVNSSQTKNIKTDPNSNKRIVALTSLSADVINTLSNESLVGIPGSTLFKGKDDFENKKIISSGRMPPNLEKIIKLNPTIVIGAEGFHDKTLKNLNSIGLKTKSLKIRNFDDLEKFYEDMNVYLKKKSNIKLKDKIPNCYTNEFAKNKKPNKVLLLASSKPILSPNSKSWSGNMLKRFRLENITSNLDSKSVFQGYTTLSPEWILKSNPTNLIVIKTPGNNISQYENLNIWNNINAVRNSRVFEFDYYGLINPGSLSSIEKACKKLITIQ